MKKADKSVQRTAPSEKTVKMRFSVNQFYVTADNREHDMATPLYEAGKVYDVPEHMVARWLKRGGDIVSGEQPTKVEEKVEIQEPQIEESVEAETESVEDEDTKPAPQQRGNRRR